MFRRPLVHCALALLVALAALPLASAAGGPRIELTMQAPEGCPGKDKLLGRIAFLIGADNAAKELIRADIVIEEPAHGTQRLRLEVRGAQGPRRRTIEGESCEALVDSAALILALLIDPDAVAARAAAPVFSAAPAASSAGTLAAPSAAGSTASAAPAASSAPLAAPSAAAPEPSRSPLPAGEPRGWAGSAAARGLLEGGLLPGIGAGVAVAGGARSEHWLVEIAALWLATRSERLGSQPTKGGDFGALGGGVAGCGRGWSAPAWGCAGVEWLRVSGQGVGVSEPGKDARWLPLAWAGARVQWPIVGPVSAEAEASLHLALARPRFLIEGLGEVWRPPFASGRGFLGLRVDF